MTSENKMKWNIADSKEIEIPINVDLLITDGFEVYVGFLDSYLEWRMKDQELCESLDFYVSHWVEFPDPPE